MFHKAHRLIIPLACLLLCSACSNTRHLSEGESLYVGERVTIKDNEGKRSYRKVVRRDLAGAVRPKPNSKFLGMRLKLTVYNWAGDTSKKGPIRKALRNFGEPPVLASTLDLQKNEELFVNLLVSRLALLMR